MEIRYKGAREKPGKIFSEADVLRLLNEIRGHGFGELSAQIVRGEIVRMRKSTVHEPIDKK